MLINIGGKGGGGGGGGGGGNKDFAVLKDAFNLACIQAGR